MKNLTLIFIFCSILFSSSLITPLPEKVRYDEAKALLGKKLFFDTRLSKDDTISCAHCHDLENGGDDGLSVSFGIEGRKGKLNSPTVLNSRYNFVQFWDGRASTLQDQAQFPVQNPDEMGNIFENIIPKLRKDEYYFNTFRSLYQGDITKENITDAIAEFEKALVTPSRFDDFLRGDEKALTFQEKEGYELFKRYGCISCHNGINLGSNLYQKVGLLIPYQSDNPDLGLYNLTKNEKDKYYFKVPTLRNIELTAPYFHGGEIKTLKEAVYIMAKHQLGLDLKDKEIEKIESFLKSLTGKRPEILDKK